MIVIIKIIVKVIVIVVAEVVRTEQGRGQGRTSAIRTPRMLTGHGHRLQS